MKRNFTLLGLAVLCLFTLSLNAQIRNYGLIYTNNMKGGHTMFGNTSMGLSESVMNSFQVFSDGRTSEYGNDHNNMQFVNAYVAAPSSLIGFGQDWKVFYNKRTCNTFGCNYYMDYTSEPGNNNSNSWTSATYNESSVNYWQTLAAPVRFNLGSGGTQLASDSRGRTTYYFRKNFTIADKSSYSSFELNLRYEDGAIVYVNGHLLQEVTMSSSGSGYSRRASSCNASNNYLNASVAIPATMLQNGSNTIAVEVHQGNNCSGSADMYFDAEVKGTPILQPATTNNSSADLILPSGTNTIKFARLYWGGKYKKNDFTDAELKSVKIRKGTSGNYGSITATSVDKSVNGSVISYQSYADITNFVKTNGAGTYTVANISATPGSNLNFGSYAGWTIVVAYENPSEPYRSVRIYDGFLEVDQKTTKKITLTGLDVPNNTLALEDAYMSTMAWEGDANLAATSKNPLGDYVKVNDNIVSNSVNPATNMWNGTISKNGQLVTTKFPNYKNQMGIDIDELQVGAGYGINAGAKTASIEFGTEEDQYFPSLFGFSIVMKNPAITIDKNVQDINGGKLAKNDELYYTLSGKNTGDGSAYNVEIIDNLPISIEFIPGSIEIQSGNSWIAYPNAAYNASLHQITFYVGSGATTNKGGTLNKNVTYKVRFKAKVLEATTIVNKAVVTAKNEALSETYTDEASVLIAADEIPLPVKFKSFSGVLRNNLAALVWETASEDNASHFELERSTDARSFTYVASVNAHGTSTEAHRYQYTDNVASIGNVHTVYYRLKIVDIDGKITFSKIIALNISENKTQSVTMYPNPLRSGQDLKLQLSVVKEQEMIVKVVTNSGQVVLSVRKQVQPGSNVVVLNELSRLNAGMYVIQLTVDGQQFVQNVLRQ